MDYFEKKFLLMSNLAKRNLNKNKNNVLRKAFTQGQEQGFEIITNKVSKEATEFHKLYNEVSWELNRCKSFLRFKVQDDKLIAKTFFNHRIEDLLVKHFSNRFPGKQVVIVNEKFGVAFTGENGRLNIVSQNVF
ncbi:MAG: DUF4130 domain-containing protein, partial [archaeon]